MENKEFTCVGQPPLDQLCTKDRFSNKFVLITGGASGIGYAVAERFASDGATVIIFDINEKNCKLARDRFEENGWKKLHTFLVDVTKRSQVDDAMATVAKITTESLHSLVTSAAYFGSQGIYHYFKY